MPGLNPAITSRFSEMDGTIRGVFVVIRSMEVIWSSVCGSYAILKVLSNNFSLACCFRCWKGLFPPAARQIYRWSKCLLISNTINILFVKISFSDIDEYHMIERRTEKSSGKQFIRPIRDGLLIDGIASLCLELASDLYGLGQAWSFRKRLGPFVHFVLLVRFSVNFVRDQVSSL